MTAPDYDRRARTFATGLPKVDELETDIALQRRLVYNTDVIRKLLWALVIILLAAAAAGLVVGIVLATHTGSPTVY